MGSNQAWQRGPQPKLTDKQKQKVRRWIVGKDPRQDGFDFALWTRAILAEMIGRKFGIALGLTAIGKRWASLDLAPQKPWHRACERHPQAVDEWLNKTDPKLRKRAKRLGASIFFPDEAGFTSEPGLKRWDGPAAEKQFHD